MFFAFVLVGCGGGKDTGLKGISISGTGNLTVGQEVTYKAVFNPSDYKDQSVTWSTSDEAALAVDQNGKATAKAASSQVYLYAQSKAEASIKGQKKLAIKEKTGIEILMCKDMIFENMPCSRKKSALLDATCERPDVRVTMKERIERIAKEKGLR